MAQPVAQVQYIFEALKMNIFSLFRKKRGQATTEVVLLFPLFVIFILFIVKLVGLFVLNQKMNIAVGYAARRYQLQSHITPKYANGWDKRYLVPRIEKNVREYLGFNNKGMRKFLSLRDVKLKIDNTNTWVNVEIVAYIAPLRIRFLCNYNKDELCGNNANCLHGFVAVCETGEKMRAIRNVGHNERVLPYMRPDNL